MRRDYGNGWPGRNEQVETTERAARTAFGSTSSVQPVEVWSPRDSWHWQSSSSCPRSRRTVVVQQLLEPEWLVEIEAIAAKVD
jgi:enamine deaminase RidA (YjgF/YER057c/UK114 family)